MNKKLIALAVSSAIAAPMAMAEDSGPTVYGRVNLALEVDDSSDDTTTDIHDVVSRFGVKGSEDLGNGLSANYQYEFRVNADRGSIRADANEQRLSWVGLSGGFGSVKVGSIWGTHYNLVGTHLDPTYTLGFFGYSSYGGGDYRIQHAINYTGNFGPVTFSADLRVDGNDASDDNLDQYVVGLKYNGPVSVAVVYDENQVSTTTGTGAVDPASLAGVVLPDGSIDLTEATEITSTSVQDREHLSVAAAYSADGWNANVGWQKFELEDGSIDRDTYHFNVGINAGDSGRVLLGYWNGEGNGADTSEGDGFLLGYYHSLSSRTKLYFEGHNGEIDDADKDVYLFGIRHDF